MPVFGCGKFLNAYLSTISETRLKGRILAFGLPLTLYLMEFSSFLKCKHYQFPLLVKCSWLVEIQKNNHNGFKGPDWRFFLSLVSYTYTF
jgi:hypothetical protein